MLEDGYSRQKISQKILDDFTDNQNNVFFEIPSVVMLEYVELLKVWALRNFFTNNVQTNSSQVVKIRKV